MAEWTALGASEICAVVLMEAGETRALYERLREPRPALIGVSGADWNDDFTPWPAPAVFRGRADFGGRADAFLQRLTEGGNSVVVIEHNLDVIKSADYLIDLGPEGGDGGGTIVATGTPEQVAQTPASYTGQFLVPIFQRGY